MKTVIMFFINYIEFVKRLVLIDYLKPEKKNNMVSQA